MSNLVFLQNLLKTPLQRNSFDPMDPDQTGNLPIIGQPRTAPLPPQLPAITPMEDPPPPAAALPATATALPPITPEPPDALATSGTGASPYQTDEALMRDRVVDTPPPPIVATLPPIGPSPRAALEKELAAVDTKRYNKGVYRNPVTGETTNNPNKEGFSEVVTAPGKDRDKKWSIWDKIGSALIGWAGGGLAGGIRGATDRNFMEKLGDENQRARLLPQIAAEQQIEKYNQDRQLQEARIQDIPADNELKRQQIEAQRSTKKAQIAAQALTRVTGLKYFDPTNTAQRKLAEDAGLNPDDLKGWDDRNPIVKKVGDTSYQYNRETGTFEPSNLPKDEAKTLTSYDVTMPNGEKRSFQVPQKDAARFAQQMNIVGAQIASREKVAAGRNAVSTANTQARLSAQERLQKERLTHGDEAVKQRAVDAFKKLYFQKKRKNPSQAEIDAYVNNVVPAPE